MLQTVEAEINTDGTIRWLEPLPVTKPSRVLVTLLEEKNGAAANQGNAAQLLEVLCSPEFTNRRSYSSEEIEAQIQENRNSWE
jgi:hypothetical protein